jgi:hypothetical protein
MATKTANVITVMDGTPHSVKIADGDLAVIPIEVPSGISAFQVVYFQSGDDTDRTPRTAWASMTPEYSAEPEKRPPPNGVYPAAQYAYQSPGGTLNCVVDANAPGMHVEMNGSHMEYHVGAGQTLYVSAANTQTGKHPNEKAQNFSVTVSGRA